MTTSLRGSHGLSARRARRTKSRGPKGLQLEVGARRAPKLLVENIVENYHNVDIVENGMTVVAQLVTATVQIASYPKIKEQKNIILQIYIYINNKK